MRNAVRSLLITAAIILTPLAWRIHSGSPRVWPVAEVPIAWWAWHTTAPIEADLQSAMQMTQTQALFLRAGQIDDEKGQLRRIRPVAGRMPRNPELHLVYNATRSLLAEFERVETAALAQTIAQSFIHDTERARCDRVRIAGIQLDFDVPTRLLPKYAELIATTRKLLPPGLKLSITGLPTWVESKAIRALLDKTDFWIPQCYGAILPQKPDQLIPIAAPAQVARAIERVRRLNHPFYAGLAAYGYAILYSRDGALLELRGDIDPALLASHPDFELIASRLFEPPEENSSLSLPVIASEWQYVYRAQRDCVIDGLVVKEGEQLMLDVPTAQSLRACARAVREKAGDSLLGICVFRLPTAADPTSLTAGEIAAALADTATQPAATITVSQKDHLSLSVTNSGTASAVSGSEAMVIALRVPAGSMSGIIGVEGFSGYETLCASGAAVLHPCSQRRASVIRLSANYWRPGLTHRAELSCEKQMPAILPAEITIRTDDGRVWQEQRSVTISRIEKP